MSPAFLAASQQQDGREGSEIFQESLKIRTNVKSENLEQLSNQSNFLTNINSRPKVLSTSIILITLSQTS